MVRGDEQLPAEDSVLSESALGGVNLDRQLGRPVVVEQNDLFACLRVLTDDPRAGDVRVILSF